MRSEAVPVDTVTTSVSFMDIPEDGTWMIPYIEKAKSLGIIQGQNKGGKHIFRPNDPITRAESLAILFNAAHIPKQAAVSNTSFKDVVLSWMKPYVAKAQELGIISGQIINGELRFRPNDPITRAEAAKIITQTTDINK